MLATGSRNREVLDIGAFHLMITPGSDSLWANFAVPTHGAFTSKDVELMVAEFGARDRVPRLEILRDLWPALPPLLEQCGFKCDMTLPMMICPADSFRQPPTIHRAELLSADGDLAPALVVEQIAFGNPGSPVDEARIERRRKSMRSGNLFVGLARNEGIPASSALLMVEGQVAELAGVGTLPEFRGKRLAGDASAIAMARFFESGGSLVWLSAADDSAFSAYRRIGFTQAGHQVNYSLPRQTAT